MNAFLLMGTALGAAIGLLHAGQLLRHRMSRDGSGMAAGLWYAAWALALWTLFGTYLLAVWIIGAVGLALTRLRGDARARQ